MSTVTYTFPFPFHHRDLDQSIIKFQQTKKSIRTPSLFAWFYLPTVRRLTIILTSLQDPEIIKEFLLCLPNCQTLDCDYVLLA
ncbi:unnamed protein product [Rotaria socialis]|uniref:Uncharacterized protein n=1 Tax=Rotaria socialis TaxID=392032 RepID=A0A817MX48_9BILA|nr:unnamed protein product [Rotaria socialis]CAF4656097.1 unnamed protein product [Rotaria socialis]